MLVRTCTTRVACFCLALSVICTLLVLPKVVYGLVSGRTGARFWRVLLREHTALCAHIDSECTTNPSRIEGKIDIRETYKVWEIGRSFLMMMMISHNLFVGCFSISIMYILSRFIYIIAGFRCV